MPLSTRNWKKLLIRAVTALLSLAVMILMGLVVGGMVVVMPPLAWLGVITLAALVLLWVMPDMEIVSDKLLRRVFFFAVIVQFTIPVYYAYAVQGLPWISIRRVTWFTLIALVGLVLATSSQARHRVGSALDGAKIVSIPTIGFMVAIVLSIFTSQAWSESLRDASDAFLYWYMALFACLLCVRSEEDVRLLMKFFCYLALIAGVAGFIEYLLQRHFIAQIWPQSMLERLFADNPGLYDNIVRNVIRNGQFRSNHIYNVSLSYGEFLSVTVALCVFFVFHARSSWERILGSLAVIACMLGVYASGSRGAVLGLSIAIPLTIALWIARYLKNNPNSLVGPIVMVSLTGLVLGVITLALAWRRFQVLFTGGAEGASSTDTRFAQWQLAQKWIISNPVTGHGSGLSGPLVGFYNPGGTVPSVDSYIISLLVEVGFVGFLSFFGMLVAAICVLVYVYLTDNEESSNCAGAIAAALTSFMIYRLALSQRENHVLLFLLVGIAIAEVAASLRRRAERQRSAGMLPAAAPLGVRS